MQDWSCQVVTVALTEVLRYSEHHVLEQARETDSKIRSIFESGLKRRG